MKKIKLVVVACLCVALFANCSSSTMIRTTDPEAKIYVDGEMVGKGSANYSDMKTILSSTEVRIQKPGCAPVTERISVSNSTLVPVSVEFF